MNHCDLHIPYDMKCATCNHDASEHWYSDRKTIWAGSCRNLNEKKWNSLSTCDCKEFKFDNLNYIEVMAERKEREKGLV